MKKTLLLGIVLLMSFYSKDSKSQTAINSITITSPILCAGDEATINIQINQSTPATPDTVKIIVGYYLGLNFVTYATTPNTTNTSINIPNLAVQTYTVFLVDSADYYATTPNGADPGSIYDSSGINITQPLQLANTANEDDPLLCSGDSNAVVTVSMTGGTPPYTISFGGGLSTTLNITTIDSTYSNLSAGVYAISVTDVNGCPVSGSSSTSITISEPPPLIPNGSVSSDYGGQDISCFGYSDGEITALATGGTPDYQYSIDGGALQLSDIFSALPAGTHTIYYIDDNGCDTSETITLNDPPDLAGSINISSQWVGVSCFDTCDGELTFIVDNILTGTPGTPASYTYSIAGLPFQISPIFPGLCGDSTHSIIVMDTNGCQYTADKTITEPTPLSFTDSLSDYNGFNISCYGINDGEIYFQNMSGGNSPYEYSIDGIFSTTNPFTGLFAGTYPATLRDDNGCELLQSVTLIEPDTFTISYQTDTLYGPTNTPIRCPASCDGAISVIPSNGVDIISYALTSYPSQTDTFWTGLCGDITLGTYTLDATDANGCLASTTITLTEPLPFVYTVDSTPEFCLDSNGTASINVTQGGTGPYAYEWDDPSNQITDTATFLKSNLYWVRVTDANGCEFLEDIFVEEDDITLSFDSVPGCAGTTISGSPWASGGQATVYPNGVPPYDYFWDIGGALTQTITGLSPGFYAVTVTDFNGCVAYDSVEIPAPSVIDLSVDPFNSTLSVLCNGYQSDTVTVIATGGSGWNTYQYNIPGAAPVQNNGKFSGLYGGTYPFVAVDFDGCSDTLIVTISEPDTFYVELDFVDVSCHSDSNGSAWVDSVSGGTAPHSYTWVNSSLDTISQSYLADSLSAGIYTLTVTDIYNCDPLSVSVTISQPTPLVSTTTIINHSSCAGFQTFSNGEAQVIANQGTPGYTYSWTGPIWPTYPLGYTGTGTHNSSLWPGTYIITIVDDTGCIHYDTAIINPGVNPILDPTIVNVSCYGADDGTITASAISGTAPYQFSYDAFSSPGLPYGDILGPTGPIGLFMTVLDAEGCTDSDSVFIVEPDLVEISSLIPENILCYDSANGKITANVTGGTGSYSYEWFRYGTSILYSNTNPALDLDTGTYFLIVTDSMGCDDTSGTQTITQPDSLYIDNITVTDVRCNGGSDGSAIATALGGTPFLGTPSYIYSWSGGIDTLSAGVDTLTVTDSMGCMRSKTFIVNEPLALSIVFGRDSVTCLGGSDGEASAIISGGTNPYSLLWDNDSTTVAVNNFNAGFHSLTVTDDTGCVFVDSVEILEPNFKITIDSLIISEITCHNAQNGSIEIVATGGYSPSSAYMYSSDSGVTTQSGSVLMNKGSGEYIMYVEDSRGCTDTSTFFLDQPDSLYIDTTIFSHVTCNGLNNGYIQAIDVIGGTPYAGIAPGSAPPAVHPYRYSVNGGQYRSTVPGWFQGYGPGTYTVQVLDSNNCAAQDIIIIEEPDALDITIITSNWNGYEVQCNGGDNGTANISINGGSGPYTKTVLDVLGNIVYTGLSSIIDNTLAPNFGGAGEYTFVITDINLCTDTSVIIYQEPTPITHSFVIDHVTCIGWSNGSITWNGSGGVGGAGTYSYLWSTLDTTYSINGLPAATYAIMVTDENGCQSDVNVDVDENNALSASVSNTEDPNCWDYCDGSIEVTPSGGFPIINSFGDSIYNYQWDDQLSQITQTAIGLCVDNQTNTDDFECIITDALGCTTTLSNITLNQPDPVEARIKITSPWSLQNPGISNYNGKNISCNGGDDGWIEVETNGGTPGYYYLWNTGDLGDYVDNLLAGDYVVIVEDDQECADTLRITLTEPTAIEASIDDITDVPCYEDSTGEISVTVTGGTWWVNNYYTYDWKSDNNIGTPDSSFDDVTEIGTGTLSDIDTGLYYVIVTDNNGCPDTSNIVYVAQPTNPLSIFMDSTDATCQPVLGTATATVLGGSNPYNYQWDDQDDQITKKATGLEPNKTYIVIVTDENGCTITDSTYINGYRNVFLPNNDDQIDDTICLGDEVEILVEDQGHTYLWSTGQTTASITVTPQDFTTIYTLSITDPACPTSYTIEAKFTVKYTIINPVATPNPLVLGDQVTIESSYSHDNYEWRWNWIDVVDINSSTYPGYYQNTANGMSMTDYPESSTWYYIEVDSNGCKGLDSVYVVVGPAPYDAISPNGDGMNDEWEILDIASYPTAEVKIFNRWGSLIFSSTGLKYNDNKWNGENGGKSLPVGTYYYTINLKDGSELQTGAVTIVR